MEKKTFGKRIVTPKHVAITVSVVIYYNKLYKDKEYTNTVYPVDTEGFVAALQQVNEEMTILRENS